MEIEPKLNLTMDDYTVYLTKNENSILDNKSLVFPESVMDNDNSVNHRKVPDNSNIFDLVTVT